MLNKKSLVIITLLSLSLTAQACNRGSGPKGVWKSTDGGLTWNKVNQVLEEGARRPSPKLDSVDVRGITVAPDLDEVLYLSTPLGVFATDSGGEVWYHVLNNVDVQAVEVAVSDPRVVYAVGNVGGRGVVYKSSDRGITWEQKYIEAAENFAWSLTVSPADANAVLVGFNSGLLISTDNGGESWRTVKVFNSRVQDIRFYAPDPSVVLMLLRDEGFFVSQDNGATFVDTTAVILDRTFLQSPDAPVERVAAAPNLFIDFDFSPTRPEVIYVTTNTGLLRTTNLGESWTELPLPVEPSNATTVAIKAVGGGGIVFVSIDTVVYRSIDGGRTYTTVKLPTDRLIRAILPVPHNPDIVYAGMIN